MTDIDIFMTLHFDKYLNGWNALLIYMNELINYNDVYDTPSRQERVKIKIKYWSNSWDGIVTKKLVYLFKAPLFLILYS